MNKLWAFMVGKGNLTLAIPAPDEAIAQALVDDIFGLGKAVWETSEEELCRAETNRFQVEQQIARQRDSERLMGDERDPAGKPRLEATVDDSPYPDEFR